MQPTTRTPSNPESQSPGTVEGGCNPAEIEKGQDEITQDPDKADTDKAPDGGLEAWLAAAGAASIFFSCFGFANSFGVFQEYYMTHQLRDRSPSDISWIGSLSAFIQFAFGAIAGPLFDRYGGWVRFDDDDDGTLFCFLVKQTPLTVLQVIRPSAVGCIFSVMMISLCEEYWQFMLAHGVLLGLLQALVQLPAMGAVSQYFDKRRAAALGLAVSGSSIGGVVFPITLSKLLNGSDIGFGWSVRIIGFIMTPFLLFACVTVRARLPPRKTNFFIWAAFKNRQFLALTAALFFQITPLFSLLFYIPTYAVSRGIDTTLASYLLAIVNAASTFGRIIPGFLADKYGRLNIFALAGFSTGIVALCLNEATNTAGLVVYSVFFGFSSGTIISGGTAAVSNTVERMQDMGTYMGMAMGLGSISALIGPPVSGALVDEYHGFSQVAIFAGVVSLAGGCIVLVAKALSSQGIMSKS